MDISVAWLNQYLDPGDVSPAEADEILTHAGLPIEAHADNPAVVGDVVLDVEVTSNRPDCLSHVGCAREIAASPRGSKARRLVLPSPETPATEGVANDVLSLENREPGACPLFTARVIRGCRVGPSPRWLAERLESIGQRPINNIVDVTNFITFELGNPCHVFDLAKLAGSALVIRYAEKGEKLRTLDERDRVLEASDLVVADAERAQSLAGVIGGAESEVGEGTSDIVFEMATWDPVTVRTQARRLSITTDAGYRFQRGIDPRTIEDAARRAVALIYELSGGVLADGVLAEGAPMPERQIVDVRLSRASAVIGIDVRAGDAIHLLRGLDIDTDQHDEDTLRCEIPAHRSRDLTREADLIEELARAGGYDRVPVAERIGVEVKGPQARRRAMTEIGRVLTGLGFDETVTFSFTDQQRAALFTPEGMQTPAVDDARRAEEPTLRPSALTGLLSCRRANQDARSAAPGRVRLFEISAAFAQRPASGGGTPESAERPVLCAVMDVPGSETAGKRGVDDRLRGLRIMRGAIDALARAMHGPEALVSVECVETPPQRAWDRGATGRVSVRPEAGGGVVTLGIFGMLTSEALAAFGLDTPVVAAELELDALAAGYPPASLAHPLPSFPAIERDLSLIVDEGVRWREIEAMVLDLDVEKLEACGFVGAYRGKQVGEGKKSVTLRLRFRDAERTLRHEEVDPQIESVMAGARKRFQATFRG